MEEMFMAGNDGQISFLDTGQDLQLDQGSHSYITTSDPNNQGLIYTTTTAQPPQQQPQQVFIIQQQQPVQQQQVDSSQYVFGNVPTQHLPVQQVLQAKASQVTSPIKHIVTAGQVQEIPSISQPTMIQLGRQPIQIGNQIVQLPYQSQQTQLVQQGGQRFTFLKTTGSNKIHILSPSPIDVQGAQRALQVSYAGQSAQVDPRQPVPQPQIVVQHTSRVVPQAVVSQQKVPAIRAQLPTKNIQGTQFQERYLKQIEQKTNVAKGKKANKTTAQRKRQQLSVKMNESVSMAHPKQTRPIQANTKVISAQATSKADGTYELSIADSDESIQNTSVTGSGINSVTIQSSSDKMMMSKKLSLQQYKARTMGSSVNKTGIIKAVTNASVIATPRQTAVLNNSQCTTVTLRTSEQNSITLSEAAGNGPPKSKISFSKKSLFEPSIIVCPNCGIETDTKIFCGDCKHPLNISKFSKRVTASGIEITRKGTPSSVNSKVVLQSAVGDTSISLRKQDFYGKSSAIRVLSTDKKQPIAVATRGGKINASKGKPKQKGKTFEEPEILTLSSDDDDDDSNSKASTNSGPTAPTVEVPTSTNIVTTSSAKKIIAKEPDLVPDIEDIVDSLKNCQVRPCIPTDVFNLDVEISLQCTTIRIGSFKFVPKGPVVLSPLKSIVIPTPSCIENTDTLPTNLEIPFERMLKMLVHFGNQMPVIFIYLRPSEAKNIRKQLNMIDRTKCYFDPLSNEQHTRRIIILPLKLDENLKNMLRAFMNLQLVNKVTGATTKIFEELTYPEANELLTQSSTSESQQVDCKFRPANTNTLLVYPPPPNKGGITITTDDYSCLEEEQFLNDVILDFYLKWLSLDKLTPENRERTHIFSTFFYKRLTTKSKKVRRPNCTEDNPVLTAAGKRHARVKSWTKNVDIFAKDFILIPINEHSHWFLAVICFPGLDGPVSMSDGESVHLEPKQEVKQEKIKEKFEVPVVDDVEWSDRDEAEGDEEELEEEEEEEKKPEENKKPEEKKPEILKNNLPVKQPCILIFDSLSGAPRSRIVATLRDYLSVEYFEKKKTEKIFSKDTMKGACPKVPQQTNFSDCGVFTLQFAESFFEKPLKCFRKPGKVLIDWFPQELVSAKRESIAKLIKSLMDEYKPNHGISLPPIHFNSMRVDASPKEPMTLAQEAKRLLENKRKFDEMQQSSSLPQTSFSGNELKKKATQTNVINVTSKPLIQTSISTGKLFNNTLRYNVVPQSAILKAADGTQFVQINSNVLKNSENKIESSKGVILNANSTILSRILSPNTKVAHQPMKNLQKSPGRIEIKDEDEVLLIVNSSRQKEDSAPNENPVNSHTYIISNNKELTTKDAAVTSHDSTDVVISSDKSKVVASVVTPITSSVNSKTNFISGFTQVGSSGNSVASTSVILSYQNTKGRSFYSSPSIVTTATSDNLVIVSSNDTPLLSSQSSYFEMPTSMQNSTILSVNNSKHHGAGASFQLASGTNSQNASVSNICTPTVSSLQNSSNCFQGNPSSNLQASLSSTRYTACSTNYQVPCNTSFQTTSSSNLQVTSSSNLQITTSNVQANPSPGSIVQLTKRSNVKGNPVTQGQANPSRNLQATYNTGQRITYDSSLQVPQSSGSKDILYNSLSTNSNYTPFHSSFQDTIGVCNTTQAMSVSSFQTHSVCSLQNSPISNYSTKPVTYSSASYNSTASTQSDSNKLFDQLFASVTKPTANAKSQEVKLATTTISNSIDQSVSSTTSTAGSTVDNFLLPQSTPSINRKKYLSNITEALLDIPSSPASQTLPSAEVPRPLKVLSGSTTHPSIHITHQSPPPKMTLNLNSENISYANSFVQEEVKPSEVARNLNDNDLSDVETNLKLMFGDDLETDSKGQDQQQPADDSWMSQLLSSNDHHPVETTTKSGCSFADSELLLSFALQRSSPVDLNKMVDSSLNVSEIQQEVYCPDASSQPIISHQPTSSNCITYNTTSISNNVCDQISQQPDASNNAPNTSTNIAPMRNIRLGCSSPTSIIKETWFEPTQNYQGSCINATPDTKGLISTANLVSDDSQKCSVQKVSRSLVSHFDTDDRSSNFHVSQPCSTQVISPSSQNYLNLPNNSLASQIDGSETMAESSCDLMTSLLNISPSQVHMSLLQQTSSSTQKSYQELGTSMSSYPLNTANDSQQFVLLNQASPQTPMKCQPAILKSEIKSQITKNTDILGQISAGQTQVCWPVPAELKVADPTRTSGNSVISPAVASSKLPKEPSPKPVTPLRTTSSGRTVATPKRYRESDIYSLPRKKKEKAPKNTSR